MDIKRERRECFHPKQRSFFVFVFDFSLCPIYFEFFRFVHLNSLSTMFSKVAVLYILAFVVLFASAAVVDQEKRGE